MQARVLRRFAAALAVAAALAGAAAAAARSPVDDAKVTATAFLTAFANEDGRTACSLLTPDLVAKLGGASACASTFSGASGSGGADDDARQTLMLAYVAAREIARRHKQTFVSRKFGVHELARAIGRVAPGLDIRVGTGPLAAKGRPVTTVVLDTRTSARRVVLYAESDSGDILRLSGTTHGVDVGVVAQGIPEAESTATPKAIFTFTFGNGFAAADGTVLLDALLEGTAADPNGPEELELLLRLVPVDGRYLVDDLYVSLAAAAGGG